jgi:hypothetical protein
MGWKNIQLPAGSKLYQVYSFCYMEKGIHYNLEINEFADGTYAGHGAHSTDKNLVIASTNGMSMEECISGLIKNIRSRS